MALAMFRFGKGSQRCQLLWDLVGHGQCGCPKCGIIHTDDEDAAIVM